MPEKVVLVLSPPVVNVPEPSVTDPAPASEPIVCARLLRSSVAPAATVKALADENALAAPARSVPALTSVLPEYVLEPERVRTPAPAFVRPPAPLIAPDSVALLPLVSMAPPPVPSENAEVKERLASLIRSVPPVNVGVLVPKQPKAAALLATNVAPVPSIALPLRQMPPYVGLVPVATVPAPTSKPVPDVIEKI